MNTMQLISIIVNNHKDRDKFCFALGISCATMCKHNVHSLVFIISQSFLVPTFHFPSSTNFCFLIPPSVVFKFELRLWLRVWAKRCIFVCVASISKCR